MPLEFYCAACQQTLLVPDPSASVIARCPGCDAILSVPLCEVKARTQEATHSQSISDNPYATPALLEEDIGQQAISVFNVEPTRFTAREWRDITWCVFTKNGGAMSRLGLVLFGVAILMRVVSYVLEGTFYYGPVTLLSLGVQLGWIVVSFVIQVALMLGGFHYCLRLLRTGQTRLGAFFAVGPFLWRGVLHYFLVSVVGAVGYVGLSLSSALFWLPLSKDLIVPLYVLSVIALGVLMLNFVAAILTGGVFIVDRQEGALGAFVSAWVCSRGSRLMMMAVIVVVGLLSLLFTICTFYVGLILVWPYWCLLISVAYLLMVGQKESISPLALGDLTTMDRRYFESNR